ncbi:hypothetical protein MHH37_11600 [Solibacillus sp. FSL K6-1781]|uniref:hypothetical protein n=1 Tax=Solibacillus sp. FSL K6-1781 TaxID=2921474 RepID=UPI003159DDF0
MDQYIQQTLVGDENAIWHVTTIHMPRLLAKASTYMKNILEHGYKILIRERQYAKDKARMKWLLFFERKHSAKLIINYVTKFPP